MQARGHAFLHGGMHGSGRGSRQRFRYRFIRPVDGQAWPLQVQTRAAEFGAKIGELPTIVTEATKRISSSLTELYYSAHTARELDALRYAAEQSGEGADKAQASFNAFSQRIRDFATGAARQIGAANIRRCSASMSIQIIPSMHLLLIYRGLGEEALMADVNEVERALAGAIGKRMLEGSGKLSEVTTIDGIVQVTFLSVTDDANVFDTLSGALLDLRLQLEVEPDLDVKIRRK